jgi:hypothetical protein
MYDIKELPLWAQRRITILERQVDLLNSKLEAIRYHDHIEDIICGVDMTFSQMEANNNE